MTLLLQYYYCDTGNVSCLALVCDFECWDVLVRVAFICDGHARLSCTCAVNALLYTCYERSLVRVL